MSVWFVVVWYMVSNFEAFVAHVLSEEAVTKMKVRCKLQCGVVGTHYETTRNNTCDLALYFPACERTPSHSTWY